jgi:hypothetical protein
MILSLQNTLILGYFLILVVACSPAIQQSDTSATPSGKIGTPYVANSVQHVKKGQTWQIKFIKGNQSYKLTILSDTLIDFGSADPYFLASADGSYAKVSALDKNRSSTDYLLVHSFPNRKPEDGYPQDVYSEKLLTWCSIRDNPGKTKYTSDMAFVGDPNDFAPIITGRKPYEESCEMTLIP